MKLQRPISGVRAAGLTIGLLVVSGSCNTTSLLNLGAARADFQPGTGLAVPRTIRVGFINNTPYRAIFTYGAYDQLDKTSIPTGSAQLRLEGHTSSATVNQPCRETFSIGGEELIQLINKNKESPLLNITDQDALVRGVNFSSAPAADPLAAQPTEGTAEPRLVLSGPDFTCARTDIRQTTGTGLLLFTFEQDATAPGGFRIDFSFVPP